MEFQTFSDLQAHLQALYQDGEFHTIFELATEQIPNFPGKRHLLYFWCICMSARTTNFEMALQLLDDLLADGFWFGETLLRKSPSLHALQGNPDFETRAARSRLLQDQEHSLLYPLLTLRGKGRCQAGGTPCPLLFALHAEGSTARASLAFWQPAALAGWLTAVPQSSQAMWKEAYTWIDLEIAESELTRRYTSLVEQYAVDNRRVVLAGQAMGGELAIWLALKRLIPTTGFIAINPSGPLIDEIENWTAGVSESTVSGLSGYLIYSHQDSTISTANIHRLAATLIEAGISTQLEEIPVAGQDYSPIYGEALLRGLSFITHEAHDV
jgi:predicted esterase